MTQVPTTGLHYAYCGSLHTICCSDDGSSQHSYNGNGEPSKLYFVENTQEQVFAVIGPYDPAIKQAHLILMAHILNDQVIIDQDNTSISLCDELHRAGIPDNQIILCRKW